MRRRYGMGHVFGSPSIDRRCLALFAIVVEHKMTMSNLISITPADSSQISQTWRFSIPEAPYAFVAGLSSDSISSLNPTTGDNSVIRIDSSGNTPLPIQQLSGWLSSYFQGNPLPTPFRLSPFGTAFQQRVWSAMVNVPYGTNACYRDIAERIGQPHAYRAVGNAIGRNPVFILIPCHRIVQSTGKTGGFRWGPEIKQQLLRLEQTGQPTG